MLINLNKKLMSISREEMTSENNEPVFLNKIIGNLLWIRSSELGDCVRFCNIAEKLYNEGEIDLDKSDIDKISNFIEKFQNNDNYSMDGFVRAQILKEISEQRLNDTVNK